MVLPLPRPGEKRRLAYYFLVSEALQDAIKDALIYKDIFGSDHCPVGLILDI